MNSFASKAIHPKRSFGARAAAVRAVIKMLREGSRTALRESERNELIACLEQTADMLDDFAAVPARAAAIAKFLEARERGAA